MSLPYSRPASIANEWVETDTDYGRRENPKGFVVDATDTTGNLIYYQKKVVDISGRNNHMFIGPSRIDFAGVLNSNYASTKVYYGTVNPGTLYSSSNKLGNQVSEVSISTKTTFLLYDNTVGAKWWRSDRWHKNQLYYYNSSNQTFEYPYNSGVTYSGGGAKYGKGHIIADSYTGDPVNFINLKNTTRHYENSTSIVPQFSDAHLYDFTQTSVSSKLIQKRIGFWETFYVAWQNGTGLRIGGFSAKGLGSIPTDSNGNTMNWDMNNEYWYKEENGKKWFESGYTSTERAENTNWDIKDSFGNINHDWKRFLPGQLYESSLPNEEPNNNTYYYNWTLYTWQNYSFDLFDTQYSGGSTMKNGPYIFEFSFTPGGSAITNGVTYYLDGLLRTHSQFESEFNSSKVAALVNIDPDILYNDANCVTSNGTEHAWAESGQKYIYYQIRLCNNSTVIGNQHYQPNRTDNKPNMGPKYGFFKLNPNMPFGRTRELSKGIFFNNHGGRFAHPLIKNTSTQGVKTIYAVYDLFRYNMRSIASIDSNNRNLYGREQMIHLLDFRTRVNQPDRESYHELYINFYTGIPYDGEQPFSMKYTPQTENNTGSIWQSNMRMHGWEIVPMFHSDHPTTDSTGNWGLNKYFQYALHVALGLARISNNSIEYGYWSNTLTKDGTWTSRGNSEAIYNASPYYLGDNASQIAAFYSSINPNYWFPSSGSKYHAGARIQQSINLNYMPGKVNSVDEFVTLCKSLTQNDMHKALKEVRDGITHFQMYAFNINVNDHTDISNLNPGYKYSLANGDPQHSLSYYVVGNPYGESLATSSASELSTNGPDPFFFLKIETSGGAVNALWNDHNSDYKNQAIVNYWTNIETQNQINHTQLFTNFILNRINTYYDDANYWNISNNVSIINSSEYNNGNTFGQHTLIEFASQQTSTDGSAAEGHNAKEYPGYLGMHYAISDPAYNEHGGYYNHDNPPVQLFFHRYGALPSFNEVNGHGPGLKWQFYNSSNGGGAMTKQNWKYRYFDTTPLGSNSAVEQEWDSAANNSAFHGSTNNNRIDWEVYYAMGKPFLGIDNVKTNQTLRYEFSTYNNKLRLTNLGFWTSQGWRSEYLSFTQAYVTCFVGQQVIIFTGNSSQPHILMSSTADGTHNGGTTYNTGVIYRKGDYGWNDETPSAPICTESEYLADTTSSYRYIIFTPATTGDLYYYSHQTPNQGGIVRARPQRPYYYVRNERDKYWNVKATATHTAGQIPAGLSLSGVPRNILTMENWREMGDIDTKFYSHDPRHPLINVIYVYQPAPCQDSSYGGYTSNIFINFAIDIYHAEVNGFHMTGQSTSPIYAGHKYTFILPNKCPGNTGNPSDGTQMNGENNLLNANNFKMMHSTKYGTSNVPGVTDGKGWNNTNWYLGPSDGWNIINANKIEFTPSLNLTNGWSWNNGNETTTLSDHHAYKMLNSTDTKVDHTGTVNINRKYKITKNNSNSIVYEFMKSVVALKSSSSSKQDMISKFNSNLVPQMSEWLSSLPSTKSKTVPYTEGNQTFPAEQTRWYHTSEKHDRIRIDFSWQKRYTKITDNSAGSGSDPNKRYNVFYNSYHKNNNNSTTNIEESGGIDSIEGGKLILTWYYKNGTIPNHFNICGDVNTQNTKLGNIAITNSDVVYGGCGVNEVIAFDTVHSEENINKYIKYLNKKWKVYKTDNTTRTVNSTSIDYINYNSVGDFIPENVVANPPTVGIGNKLFHFNGDAKNIAGANMIVPSAGSLVQTDTNQVIFDTNVLNYKLVIPNQDFINFTVTNADATQPTSTINGNTGLEIGVDKTVTITTISESRLKSIVYSIVVTRRSPAQEADHAAEEAFGSAGNDPNHPVNFLKDVNNTGGISETAPVGATLQNFLKNNITGNESQKRAKRKAQLKILLSNFPLKKMRISPDTLASPIIPSSITSVVVFKPSLIDKPDLSATPAGEAVYVPLDDNEETALVVNNSTIIIKCIDSTGDGNFTLTLPSQQYVNTNDVKVNNIAVTSVSHSNLKFDDVLIIDGKTIIIGSVTYTGNAGTLRVNLYNQFIDTSSHQNDLIQIGNNFFQINLNPSSYQNFWENPTFWSNTNITTYNNDCNITYDTANAQFEYFISSISTANLNIKGASGNSSIYNNQNTSITANTLEEEFGASTHLFKNNRTLPIDGNNSETHNNLLCTSNTKNIIHHNTFNKFSNHQNKTFEKNSSINSNINKSLTIHSDKDIFKHTNDTINIFANSSISIGNTVNTNYVVTVQGGKYYFNGSLNNQTINIYTGLTTIFDLNSSTLDAHPLGISDNPNGLHSTGGNIYVTNVTYELDGVSKSWTDYRDQFSTATTRRIIFTPSSNQNGTDLHYFCAFHQNMGSGISGSTDNAKLSIINNTSSYLKNNFNTNSITINGNKKADIDSQDTNVNGNYQLKDTVDFTSNIYGDLIKKYDNNTTNIYKNNSTISSKNKSLDNYGNKTVNYHNNSSKISYTQNTNIENNLTEQYKSNHTLTNYDYKKSFYHNNISLSYKNDYNLTIHKNNTINIHGLSKLNYNNTISTIDNNNIKFNHNLNKTIHNTQQTFTSNQDINIHHYNVNVVGNYKTNMQNKYNISTTTPIKISSAGGLQISSNLNHSLQLNSNVGISNSSIISNVPYNLTTSTLSSYINDSGTETSMFIIDPVHSFVLITLDTNNTIAQSYMTKDLYIRFNLKPGKYNGQQIKIALHPIYQKFFDNVNNSNYNSINKRINNNLNTDIIIRIDSLCDTNTNEFVTADLILNKGGMCLNLLYVDENDNHPIASSNNINPYRTSGLSTTGTGYWMLIGNSFTS